MATRTAYAGTATTGGIHAASNDNSYSGGWIGYNQATSSQSSITAEVDLTGLSVTVTVNTSRRIKITGHAPAIEFGAVDARFILAIKESTTTLSEVTTSMSRTGASFTNATAIAVLTPSSGSHTYKLSGEYDQGSGSATLNFSSTAVGFILVEDVGPAS